MNFRIIMKYNYKKNNKNNKEKKIENIKTTLTAILRGNSILTLGVQQCMIYAV